MSGKKEDALALSDANLARVEAEIAETRERVASSVVALEREIIRAFDWHEWVRRQPIPALAIAFGVGWFFGRAIGGGRYRGPL